MKTEKYIIIKHINPRYKYCQEARCLHCRYFYYKPTKNRGYSAAYCTASSRQGFVHYTEFACDMFEPNDKYVIANKYKQLNLFENA